MIINDKICNQKAERMLLGRKITQVRYTTQEELLDYGWDKRPIMFTLDNNIRCVIYSDDEGNNGGSLALNDEFLPTI